MQNREWKDKVAQLDRKHRGMDRSGQMAFSMVAVILLLVAGATIMVYGPTSILSQRTAADLASREDACQDAYETLKETTYGVAWAALNSSYADIYTARMSFLLALNESLRETSPYLYGQHRVVIDANDIDISIMPMGLTSADEGDALYPAFFMITGTATINVTDDSGMLSRTVSINDDLYLPLPLLNDLTARLSASISNSDSNLWSCVRYEICCLMQFRALQDPSLSKDSSQTALLATEEDVKNAIVLSTILMQRSVLHTYDQSLIDDFVSPSGGEIFTEAIEPYLAMDGELDPADLYLILYGIGDFPLHQALAQSLYSAADLLALRYLDYFHVIGIIDFIEETVQSGLLLINDVLNWAFGKDIAANQAIEWVKNKLSQAGHQESEYRYLWTSEIDWLVEIPKFGITFQNSSGGLTTITVGGNFSLDIGTVDLLESSFWKNTFVTYTKGTGELAQRIVALFQDIATAMAGHSSITDVPLNFDPFDGLTPIQTLARGLDSALQGNDGWFNRVSSTLTITPGPDPLGEAMVEALDTNPDILFGKGPVIQEAFYSLTEKMYERAVESNPELENAPHENNLMQLRTFAWEDRRDILDILNHSYAKDTDPLISTFKTSFLQAEDQDFLNNCLIRFSSGMVASIPSIESWVEDRLHDMMNDVIASFSLSGIVTNVTMPEFGQLILGDRGSGTLQVQVIPRTTLDNLQITVHDPVHFKGQLTSIHITDLLNASSTPFQASWGISMTGSMSTHISVRSPSGLFPSMSRTITSSLEMDIRPCIVTGWPMAGVDYRPSHTLASDALALLKDIWNLLSKMIGYVADSASQVLQWVMKAVQEGGKMAEAALKMAVGNVGNMLEYARQFVENQLVDVLGAVLERITSGRSIQLVSTEFLGISLSICLNQGDLALAKAKNIVKMTIGYKVGSDSVSVSGRIIRIDHDYQLLINGTILRPGTKLTLVVDPFMTAFSHFIEVRGWAGDTYVEMNIPEISRFTTYSFTLQDLPALKDILAKIPSPIPGVVINLNAGISVRFATTSDPHPVINEFEANPSGSDAGKEWVEIFNPSDQVITLSGWSLQTTHGIYALDVLGDIIMLPFSRIVYTFSVQTLDNGDTKTFPFSDGLALLDPEGKRVDVAPIVMDQKNDGRTWQRADDGSEQWEFRTSTKGSPNSHVKYTEDNEVSFLSLATNMFSDVVERCEASGWTVEALSYAVKTTLLDFQRNMLEAWGESMLEASVFVEYAFTDESGAAGVGQKYSLSIDSEFFIHGWEWMCTVIAKIIADPLHGPRIVAMSTPDRTIFEHVWLGVQTFVKIGTPKIMENLEMNALADANGKLCLNVKSNLAMIGYFIGKDLGKPKMAVGVDFVGALKSKSLKPGMAACEQSLEVWVFKLTLSKP